MFRFFLAVLFSLSVLVLPLGSMSVSAQTCGEPGDIIVSGSDVPEVNTCYPLFSRNDFSGLWGTGVAGTPFLGCTIGIPDGTRWSIFGVDDDNSPLLAHRGQVSIPEFCSSESFSFLLPSVTGGADATVTIVEPSPQDQIEGLKGDVQALVPPLSQQDADKLLKKLNSALDALNEDPPKIGKAIGKLTGFQEKVQGLIDKGDLTVAQGQPLIDAAQQIIDGLS